MDDTEIINEFLIESTENLARLDLDLVELERRPQDAGLLASIFRTIHTIKGTCGFLNFPTLERITHQAENILSEVRNGERDLTPQLISLTLETVDAVRAELTSIESTSHESGEAYAGLLERQKAVAATPKNGEAAAPTVAAVAPVAPPPVEVPFEVSAVEEEAEIHVPIPILIEPEPRIAPPTKLKEIQMETARTPEPAPPSPAQSTPALAFENDAAATQKTVSVTDSTIRVDVSLLDKLMNLVGELVLARNQILQFNVGREDARLSATTQRLNLITRELQESVMKTRMQPIGTIWNKLPRVVRDLSASCGKQINLELDGAETELDKTIIEAIKDPLTHIVRNSCDHGIETSEVRLRAGKRAQGTLRLRAFHEGGNVNIDISDDGGGIDPQKVKKSAINKGLVRPEIAEGMTVRELVNLVFLPGFSTASQISNISGRGVGMDVVKTNIEKIGGTVNLDSQAGEGTTVKIKIPLTLAIIPGMVVTSGGERFVIPQVNLLDLVRLEKGSENGRIEFIQGTPVYRRRGNLLPLVYLNTILELNGGEEDSSLESDVTNIVVLQAEDRQFGLVVDGINDTQEIVVKPLGKQLKGVPVYAGATIMGDGKVALILDVAGIARTSSVLGQSRVLLANDKKSSQEAAAQRQMLLLFRSGDFERLAVPLSLVARLEEIPRSQIESSANGTVLQYRGEIISLVPLAARLGSRKTGEHQDPAQVVVFADGNRRIGFIVDQIIDIVEEAISVKKASAHPGLLGSAVIGNKVTDFLDVHSVIDGCETGWFQNRAEQPKPATVLVADGSAFARGLLRTNIEMAGHRVIEAANVAEALEKLNKQQVHVVTVSLDLPGGAAFDILETMGKHPALRSLPVLALTSQPSEVHAPPAGREFTDYLFKYDRAGMLRSLDRLAEAVGGPGLIEEPVAELAAQREE